MSDLVFGVHPVIEALESGKTLDKILLNKESKGDGFQHIRRLAKELGVAVSLVPVQKLNRVTRANHQGVLAFISPIDFHKTEDLIPTLFEKKGDPVVLVLDGITDVRNFGSILRTSECMGVDAVIIPARNSVAVNADTVKTSAGAVFNLPICKELHFGSSLQYLKEYGFSLVGASEKASVPVHKADLSGPLALVMGAEGEGIHEKTLEKLDEHVLIPMAGKTGSLNVAVATGMILYELVRQKSN